MLFQAQDTMREIHMNQEEKLLTQQQKEKAALEKSHSKSRKKAADKNMSMDQIQSQISGELAQIQREQEESVQNTKLQI